MSNPNEITQSEAIIIVFWAKKAAGCKFPEDFTKLHATVKHLADYFKKIRLTETEFYQSIYRLPDQMKAAKNEYQQKQIFKKVSGILSEYKTLFAKQYNL